MRHLSIDLETYSGADIKKTGLYRYASDPDFEILLFAYAVDFEDVKVVDFTAGEKIPEDIEKALSDKNVIKHAYNAAFEITCLNASGFKTPVDQWEDTMLLGAYAGYPLGLANLGKALGISEDKQKMKEGKALIRYFCQPCKPTRTNGGRTRNLPKHEPEKWELFKEYNRMDVVTEIEDYKYLQDVKIPADVQKGWVLDYKANSTGITLDMDLVGGALRMDEDIKTKMLERAVELTGLSNPNSRNQMLNWVNSKNTFKLEDLRKATVDETIANPETDPEVREALTIRLQLSKSSVSKYTAMDNAVCPDGRVRGLLQYYGARTGRWAGRLVQVQNLPRTYIENLDFARELVKRADLDGVRLMFGDPADTLSQLIRTAFIAKEGYQLCVADFSAIEARVLSWMAKQEWRQKVFAENGDIYCASASEMFGVPVVKNGINGHLRQKGKVAELALGYQGGPGALTAMGALQMGLTEDELPGIVQAWRNSNSRIKDLWYKAEEAVVKVMRDQVAEAEICEGVKVRLRFTTTPENKLLSFLTISLPSGRALYYPEPVLGENRFGGESLHFKTQVGIHWVDQETYGGKLIENITQAIARDCLMVTMLRVEEKLNCLPLMHIHDEIVIEVPEDGTDWLKKAIDIMSEPISWAPGLKLNADGFVSPYYKKD